MSFNFYIYYKEIKHRVFITLLAWIFYLCISYLYKETLLFTLINLNYSLAKSKANSYFIFTDVTEVFNVYLELSLFVANQLGIVFLLYQMFMFFTSGLYKFEYIKLKFAFQVFTFSWVISTIFLYSLIIPFSWNFFLSFQQSSDILQPFELFFETRLIKYFHYLTSLYYMSVISCQFLGFFTIILTGLNERFQESKTFRKLFYLIFIIFSTIITPPDVISQIIISLCLIIVFEFLLLLKFITISMATN